MHLFFGGGGGVIIFGNNLTVRIKPQHINLRIKLNPKFFSKMSEKLGLSLILKLISSCLILTVMLAPQIFPLTSKSVNWAPPTCHHNSLCEQTSNKNSQEAAVALESKLGVSLLNSIQCCLTEPFSYSKQRVWLQLQYNNIHIVFIIGVIWKNKHFI